MVQLGREFLGNVHSIAHGTSLLKANNDSMLFPFFPTAKQRRAEDEEGTAVHCPPLHTAAFRVFLARMNKEALRSAQKIGVSPDPEGKGEGEKRDLFGSDSSKRA
jgi:hypothetical protein